MAAENIPPRIFPQKKPHVLNPAIKKGLINPTFFINPPQKASKGHMDHVKSYSERLEATAFLRTFAHESFPCSATSMAETKYVQRHFFNHI